MESPNYRDPLEESDEKWDSQHVVQVKEQDPDVLGDLLLVKNEPLEEDEFVEENYLRSDCDMDQSLDEVKIEVVENGLPEDENDIPCDPSVDDCNLHKCYACLKIFEWKFLLTEHLQTHTEDSPFRCVLCSRVFRYNARLKRHMKTCHSSEGHVKCLFCEMTFSSKTSLATHMRTHTFGKKCPHCPFIVHKNYGVINHTKTHKTFKRFSSLKQHLRETTGDRPNSSALNRHLISHQELRPFKCSHTQNTNLQIHLPKHTDERPLRCSYCPESFISTPELKLHLKMHTSEN